MLITFALAIESKPSSASVRIDHRLVSIDRLRSAAERLAESVTGVDAYKVAGELARTVVDRDLDRHANLIDCNVVGDAGRREQQQQRNSNNDHDHDNNAELVAESQHDDDDDCRRKGADRGAR